MVRPLSICSCCKWRTSSQHKTVSFMLLSGSLIIKESSMYAEAKKTMCQKRQSRVKLTDTPLTAAGFWVSKVNVVAASYLTACEDTLSSSKMRRMYRARWAESVLQSNLTTSMTLICNPSSKVGMLSWFPKTHSTALLRSQWARNVNALRLHVESASAARKVLISSEASGIKCSNSR